MLIAEAYGKLYEINDGRLVIEYGGEIFPVISTYGDIYVTPYGFFKGFFKSIGSIIHGAGKAVGAVGHAVVKGVGAVGHAVVKGVGTVIHYTGKFLGAVAPLAVPLLVGVGVSAVAGAIFGASAATASAATVAKAAIAGNLLGALGGAAIYATKVVATHIISSQILRALYKKKHGEVVIAKGNRPALIIPAFVRELVEPHHLVNYATKHGTIHNSKIIQSRIDWLAVKIKATAKQIVNIYRQYGINVDESTVINHLKNIFWNIPSSKVEIESKINSYLNNLRKTLCQQGVRNLWDQVLSLAPEFAAHHSISEYTKYCPRSLLWIKSKIESDIRAWYASHRPKQPPKPQPPMPTVQYQPSTRSTFPVTPVTPVNKGGMIGGIKQEYLILGGILLVALLANRNK